MNSIKIAITALVVGILPVTSNYYEPNMCKFNERIGRYIGVTYKHHIAYGNSLAYQNVFGASCYQYQIIPMSSAFINLILTRHNTLRAQIANGRIPGYLSANQMSEMCRKTGTLLNEPLMRRNIDARFRRSVEIYSGQILLNTLNMTGLGLFSFDSSIMFSLVSTASSYLLILIQFELKLS